MRRLILGAFLLCAACGGGARNPAPGAVSPDPAEADNRAARTQVAFSSDAQATIANYERVFGQDRVESCLQEWIVGDGAQDPGGLISKPDIAGLRTFLSECLVAPLRGAAH